MVVFLHDHFFIIPVLFDGLTHINLIFLTPSRRTGFERIQITF
jgi:hypothetical protein